MWVGAYLVADAESFGLVEPGERSLPTQRVLPRPEPCGAPRRAILGVPRERPASSHPCAAHTRCPAERHGHPPAADRDTGAAGADEPAAAGQCVPTGHQAQDQQTHTRSCRHTTQLPTHQTHFLLKRLVKLRAPKPLPPGDLVEAIGAVSRRESSLLPVPIQEPSDPADRRVQVVGVRKGQDPEVVGAGPVEAGALDDLDLLLEQ